MAKRYEVSVYSKIQLGRPGENLAREIAFDISEWVKDYGDGDVHLFHRRNTDTKKYPVPIKIEDNKAIWTVTEPDVAIPGTGECELEYTAGDTVAKTRVYETEVQPSMSGGLGKVPAPADGWYAEAQKAVKTVLTENGLMGVYFGSGPVPKGYRMRLDPGAEVEEIIPFSLIADQIKAQAAQAVLDALGTPVYGTVDIEKNIDLSGDLVDGEYTLSYINADGSKTVIVTGIMENGTFTVKQ